MKILLWAFLISLSSHAAHWSDLEEGQHLKLGQELVLKQTDRSGSLHHLVVGEKFKVTEIMGLHMINVTLFKLSFLQCRGLDLATNMEIISVGASKVEVGALIEKCNLEIYIENKDLFTESFFSNEVI